MTTRGFFGDLGGGKTHLLTLFSWFSLRKNIPVYSNYKMKGCNQLEGILGMRDIGSCFVAIDEVLIEMDSRNSGGNALQNLMLMGARKRELDVGYTAQMLSIPDKRLRFNTNEIYKTIKLKYPTFLVTAWSRRGTLLHKFKLVYGDVIADMFDTDELVKILVSRKRLNKVYNLSSSSKKFVALATVSFGWKNNLAGAIYEALKNRERDYVDELLLMSGYVLDAVVL